jgi:hypothetical protein
LVGSKHGVAISSAGRSGWYRSAEIKVTIFIERCDEFGKI